MFGLSLYRNSSVVKQSKERFSQPDIPGLFPVLTPEKLLKPHVHHIKTINELAGVSKSNFDRFYLESIQHFARFVQQLPASEVHHHSGPGGLLQHALEVCVTALKIRRSYLLSATDGAEEIARKQDSWTYAIFTSALCHDLAKPAVDQAIVICDKKGREVSSWDPWSYFMDEQGAWYISHFVRDRQYRLHEKASTLLVHRIIPKKGMSWLGSDQTIFSQWLASLSGDLENAGSIGEITGQADSQSVAKNLGADATRMPGVKTIPLHEKMLTALRYLLLEGKLPINRNGAAGWIKGNDCWLVSKRTIDAIREQLTQEGHTGIPTKNGRLFDELQENAILVPNADKAIWTARIVGDG
jgi:conjugal transfer pilus assembly protein TraI